MYLNGDPKDLVQEYMDMTEGNTLSAIERTVAGIYVARQTPGSNSSDVGVILEGVVVLRDLENVALATAMLFGFFYILNMRYPSKLHYTLEVIQKIIMELDAADLSRKAQSLTSKVHQLVIAGCPKSLPFVPFAVMIVIFLHIIVAVVYLTRIEDSPRAHYSTADGDGVVSLE
ncbi:hypothetical protein SRHO_G00074230 [Serrasalmus rhombeus]